MFFHKFPTMAPDRGRSSHRPFSGCVHALRESRRFVHHSMSLGANHTLMEHKKSVAHFWGLGVGKHTSTGSEINCDMLILPGKRGPTRLASWSAFSVTVTAWVAWGGHRYKG